METQLVPMEGELTDTQVTEGISSAVQMLLLGKVKSGVAKSLPPAVQKFLQWLIAVRNKVADMVRG